ncbi:hypothetical protein [Streptomyces sp. NPDC047046]|uniref:hypothetical protein n=1 Tax=Streptomyces sp. NPDC047046 TaxID=3155378 RepID=UPI0034114CB4
MTRHTDRLRDLLHTYLHPTWDDAWHALALLRTLPQPPDAHRRWDTDRDRFTACSTYLADDGRPQPIKDDAVSAARRRARLEQAAGAFETRRALEDDFVMAERRTNGEALTGTVSDANPHRTVTGPTGRAQRKPRFTLHTTDPVRLDIGNLLAGPHSPGCTWPSAASPPRDGGSDLLLEVTTLTTKPDSVPAAGDDLCLTLAPEFFRQPPSPAATTPSGRTAALSTTTPPPAWRRPRSLSHAPAHALTRRAGPRSRDRRP